MNDFDSFDAFEEKLRLGLNREVDQQLGAQRRPPVFHPPAHERRPWLVPLLAAACVLLIVGATFGARQLITSRPAPPAAPPPSVSVTPPPASSSPSKPSVSTSDSGSTGNTVGGGSASDQTPVTVQLGGVTLQLPHGWESRTPGPGGPTGSWCLTPASAPAAANAADCQISLTGPLDENQNAINSDTEGGFNGNPEYCFHDQSTTVTTSADKMLGGRAADFREFLIHCDAGQSYQIDQYVVATTPVYVLSMIARTDQLSSTQQSTLFSGFDFIVNHAQLPAETGSVRLYDHGYIRSITPVAGGVRIALDRVVPGPNGPENNNPATYDYTVPSTVLGESKLAVGQLVSVFTNGSVVTSLY